MTVVEVLPNLWLGDIRSALDVSFLSGHKITVVINCTVRYPFSDYCSQRYRVAVRDRGIEEDINIMYKYLVRMVPFIHKFLLSGERVLIHCYAGCHRSVCLVLGYIMCYTQFSLQESIDVLQSKWNRVGLNFLQSLVNYSLLIKRVR